MRSARNISAARTKAHAAPDPPSKGISRMSQPLWPKPRSCPAGQLSGCRSQWIRLAGGAACPGAATGSRSSCAAKDSVWVPDRALHLCGLIEACRAAARYLGSGEKNSRCDTALVRYRYFGAIPCPGEGVRVPQDPRRWVGAQRAAGEEKILLPLRPLHKLYRSTLGISQDEMHYEVLASCDTAPVVACRRRLGLSPIVASARPPQEALGDVL